MAGKKGGNHKIISPDDKKVCYRIQRVFQWERPIGEAIQGQGCRKLKEQQTH